MLRLNCLWSAVLLLSLVILGCQDLAPRDAPSPFIPRFQRSELFGFLAGTGTTIASVPDLVATLRRRSCAGNNPRMEGDHRHLSDLVGSGNNVS